eukprot:NODE_1065_length_1122_cov_65.797763_g814_i0.p7 GENE.NODE_1065_length_1122_cov_65.797763_g814_i0~~NODE_1065_length_1122_cov_65.797763_g814_i0.p7  ORF type:complete len:58 (-),score=13.96 NODE_1065_length_1122_cov_65.797763_g814_i0:3-176(-)
MSFEWCAVKKAHTPSIDGCIVWAAPASLKMGGGGFQNYESSQKNCALAQETTPCTLR